MASTVGGDAASGRSTAIPGERSWLRTFLVVTLTVLIPLCLYYFVYAAWNAAETQRRALRLLAATAHDVADNSARRARVLAWSSVVDPNLGTPPKDAREWCGKIAVRLKSNRLLDLDPSECRFDSATSPQWNAPGTLRLHLEDGPSGWLYVLELRRYGMFARATVPLRDLIPFGDANQADFDALVVRELTVDQKTGTASVGAVLAHDTDFVPELIERVDAKRPKSAVTDAKAADADAKAAGGDAKAAGGDAKASAADGAPPPAAPSRWSAPDFLQFRDHPRSKIAKEEFVTFAVPVTLRVPPLQGQNLEPKDQVMLSIEGLASPERLRTQALALSPTSLTYVICAVIAALLTLPYLKIRFMARRERLRRVDLGMLAATALGGTALATVFILHGTGRWALREWMDRRMADVGQAMQARVSEEVGLITQQLDAGGKALVEDKRCALDGPHVVAGAYLLHNPKVTYPDFESVFCTDGNGKQLSKWMARANPSPPVPIAENPYFRRALMLQPSGDGKPTASADASGADPFVFDRVTAKTSGLRLAVFAKPLDGAAPAIGAKVALHKRTGVLVLSTQMHTLSDAVLPRPFQYVVVREDEARGGTVLFPDGRRHQQFFADARGDRRLRLLINGADQDGSTPVDREYLGKTYRMQAFALPSLPNTSLIVFYDMGLLDGVSAETVASGAVAVVALVFLSLLAVLVATMLRGAALDAIWPTVQHWPIYVAGIVGAIGFAGAVVAVADQATPATKALVLIVAPAVAILAFLLIAPSAFEWSKATILGQTAHRRLYPSLYLIFATVALLAVAAVPTALIVRDASEAYVTALRDFIVRGHEEDARRRYDVDLGRFVKVDDTVQTTPDADVGERIFVRSDDYGTLGGRIVPLAFYRDLDDKFGAVDGTAATLPAVQVPSNCGFFGFSDGEALPQTYLAAWPAACLPTITGWHDALRDHLWLVDRRHQRAGLDTPISWGAILCGVLLVAVVFVFVKSIAARILGLTFEDDGVHDRAVQVLGATATRWLLLRPTNSVIAALPVRIPATTLDLSRATITPADIDATASAGGVVVLLHLECRIHDPAMRDAVRRLIAAPSVSSLYVVSEIDPLHYLAARAGEQPDDATETAKRVAEIDAWAQALRTLEKARFAKPAQPAMGPPAPAPTPPPGTDPMTFRRLHRECESSDVLQDIEQDLLARSDFTSLDWDAIVEYIQDVAEPHYRAVWGLCSEEEKLTLIQLAEEGVINPRNFDVLRRLRRRRLVRCDPRFRIVNESFRRFVVEAEPREQVARWELPATASTWARLRTPLLLLLVVVTAILVITQQGAFNDTLGVAAAATGAVGAVATVIAQARRAFTSTA